MCESHAYLLSEQEDDQLLLEDVVMLRPHPEKIVLTNILGDQKEVQAEIDHIDLLKHRIVLRPKQQGNR